ncbi:hypothetical protein RYX36_005787, partial [Vicia faba]
VQVVRIFTDMSISPSISPRQCLDCYTFCAGRNLPDKEFRYLRTVIVMASVHRSISRRLLYHQPPPSLGTNKAQYKNLNLLSIDYAFRPDYVSVRQVVSCLLVNSTAVRKVDLFENPRIFASLQLLEAFRRLVRPSSSLGAPGQKDWSRLRKVEMEADRFRVNDFDKATQNQLARGQRLRELLKQSQSAPLTVEEQIITIYTGTNSYLDSLEIEQ